MSTPNKGRFPVFEFDPKRLIKMSKTNNADKLRLSPGVTSILKHAGDTIYQIPSKAYWFYDLVDGPMIEFALRGQHVFCIQEALARIAMMLDDQRVESKLLVDGWNVFPAVGALFGLERERNQSSSLVSYVSGVRYLQVGDTHRVRCRLFLNAPLDDDLIV